MAFKISPGVIIAAICLLYTCRSAQTSIPCCDFENDFCDAELGSAWIWSYTEEAHLEVPTPSSTYIWTINTGAAVTFPATKVTPTSIVSFTYFINSATSIMQLNFFPTNGIPITVATIYKNSSTEWIPIDIVCTKCCGGASSCEGEFALNGLGSGTDFEIALDNFAIDGQCHITFSCCYFDDAALCDYSGGRWTSSDTVSPVFPPITGPLSNYVYFEVVKYIDAEPIDSPLNSATTTITSTTKFRGNIYVYKENTESTSDLQVNFMYGGTTPVLLGIIPETDGMFRVFDFDCAASNCCKDATDCIGNIQFNAHVQEKDGGTVLYAIDTFEVAETCDLFPGKTKFQLEFNKS